MSNKKELLKKSLGISEYPWSSDDEDAQQPMPDIHLLRRQASEPRPSVADLPGTSGQSRPIANSQFAPLKKNHCDNFDWSYTSSSSHKTMTPTTRSRLFDTAPRPQNNLSAIEVTRTQRQPDVADIQRMMAIKKLTRTLGNLRSSKSSSSLFTTSPRSLSGTSRNPPFPSLKADVPIAKAYRHFGFKQRIGCRGLQTYNYNNVRSSTAPLASQLESEDDRPSPFSNYPLSAPPAVTTTTEPIVVIDSPNTQPIEDDNDTSDLPTEPQMQEDNRIDDSIEVMDTSHNASGSGVSLEEEIVEIDPQDDTDGNANGDSAAENSVVNADVSLNEVQIVKSSSNDEADALPSLRNESDKKKSEDNKSSEDADAYTVKEFNQSLLRLLECPVCLEWMEPPMSQCRRGHLVCGRCRARLASCPVCRTTFSSVRNRAMEGVAEMVRYPCRHGCGREVRLRRRGAHEASCGARRYACPAPGCAHRPPLAREHLTTHFQSKHMTMMKIGRKHKFSMKVNSEQHDTWIVAALHEYFSLRVDVDIRTWGVVVYVAYIGPKCNAKNFIYEVSVVGQHNSRKLVYTRATHCDLESSSLNVSRQDCFHLTLDQALNFLRVKNRHCEPDKFLDFNVEISKCEVEVKDDSDS